jgi:hypothetical protein
MPVHQQEGPGWQEHHIARLGCSAKPGKRAAAAMQEIPPAPPPYMTSAGTAEKDIRNALFA